MHGHDTTQEAATTKVAPRTMTRIVLVFEDVNGETYEKVSVNSPTTHGNAPYQRAVQMMLEEELDCQSELTAIQIGTGPRRGVWDYMVEIDRLTLHQWAGEEAIAQQKEA